MRRPTPLDTACDTRGACRHAGARGIVVVAAIACLGVLSGAAYTVRPGDTLSQLAMDHGVSTSALAGANGIEDPDLLLAGDELTIPAGAPTRANAEAESAHVSTGAVEGLLEEIARDHGFSPRFVKAIAWQESGFQQSVVSSAGAVGVMQVMPGTGRFVSRHLAGRELDLADPRDNIEAGVVFLQHLWDLTGGDAEMTLAGYYQGLKSVRTNGMYADTERYIDNVLALRDRF